MKNDENVKRGLLEDSKFAFGPEFWERIGKEEDKGAIIVLLKEQEKWMQKEAHRMLFASEPLEHKSTMKPQPSIFQFELKFALPGLLALICYCSTHLAVYEVLASCFAEFTKSVESQTAIHMLLIVLALIVTRLTGGVWEWVDNVPEGVECRWDRRFLDVFKNRPTLKSILEYSAIYACLIGVQYFQYMSLRSISLNRYELSQQLPSHSHDNISTPVARLLRAELGGGCTTNQICSLEDRLQEEDLVYLYSILSTSSYANAFGDESTLLVEKWTSISFYFSIMLVSLFLLMKLGYEH